MKPNSFTFANEDNELIKPMFIPLVFQSDTYDRSESNERHALQSLRAHALNHQALMQIVFVCELTLLMGLFIHKLR